MDAVIALAAHELSGPGGVGPVDLLVPSARLTALLVPAGTARTTLLHLLSGHERPTGGWVEIARIRLDELSQRHLSTLRRTRVGLVLAHFNLVPYRSVLDNVRVAGAGAAEEMLALVGLGDRAAALARELTGDERARVALARALASRPAVVLVDHPDLDVEVLRRAVDATGAAIVLATDDATRAAAADRVVAV